MAATTAQLIALGNDAAFRQRVRNLMLQICSQVYGEDAGTASHGARVAFAFKIVQSPGLADQFAAVIATRTNLVASTVSYNFADGQVQTDASDGAILSQIATDWNFLAGV